jgi:hypothetical protein
LFNAQFSWRQAALAGFYLGIAATLLMPARLSAQAKLKVTQNPINPVNPLGLPTGPITNYTRPVRNVISPREGRYLVGEVGGKNPAMPTPTPCPSPSPLHDWTFTLSESYQYLNDRSRTGGISSTSDSAITDVTAVLNKPPWTCLDFSYLYSHASGSAPAGVNQIGNQNVGSFSLLQPFYPFRQRKPAPLTTDSVNDQFAIIVTADYGESFTTTTIPLSPSIRSSTKAFVGNALFDWQRAWFPGRKCYATYPGWLFEISSGIQFDDIRLRSATNGSSFTSFGQQLTYRNVGSATYSFSCGFGLLAAAEWDAPLHNNPLSGSQAFYANTAVFTGGLVYNIYANRIPQGQFNRKLSDQLSHWSASLLYSYTAFNPLVETNQLQVQLSYSF